MGQTMEGMKINMKRMKRQVEIAVKRRYDFVRYMNIAMDRMGEANAKILNKLEAKYERGVTKQLQTFM